MSTSVAATMAFWPSAAPDITTAAPRLYDMRKPREAYAPWGLEVRPVDVLDARMLPGNSLESYGFQLLHEPSAVRDFYDNAAVMRDYYAECRILATQLTGATYTYTFDHLIREPGRQISGGGTDGKPVATGADAGGGYVGAVHVDYTANTTWHQYLAVHGERMPRNIVRTVALNFWRPVGTVVTDHPLGVCDARTVAAEDLFETIVFGYGARNYSWHDLGIETYNVKASPRQRWYYFPEMTPDEVLVFKSYDSDGVIGRACPHGALSVSGVPDTQARRSIELRVLCFCTAEPG